LTVWKNSKTVKKDKKLDIRISSAEQRAIVRLAKSENKTVTDLVRSRVINPALNFNPRQLILQLEKEERERRAS
jgi:uncharacterized protein (DUF1778 family)